jgi:hypothetical protein
MDNNQRLTTGQSNTINGAAKASTKVDIGDLMGLVADQAVPASSFARAASVAAVQEAFHDDFLGVTMDARSVLITTEGGANDRLLIATTGRAVFPTADSSARAIGTLWGAAPDAIDLSNNYGLQDQVVANVATVNLAIGRLTKPKLAADRVVELEIFGSLTAQGVQAVA